VTENRKTIRARISFSLLYGLFLKNKIIETNIPCTAAKRKIEVQTSNEGFIS
jgi:hypothetical protein